MQMQKLLLKRLKKNNSGLNFLHRLKYLILFLDLLNLSIYKIIGRWMECLEAP